MLFFHLAAEVGIKVSYLRPVSQRHLGGESFRVAPDELPLVGPESTNLEMIELLLADLCSAPLINERTTVSGPL
jgi:hypothetical protein